MSGDKLIFDLSQEIEGSPNVFIRKDWLNILDNMNQNYAANQSIIDTSQLSNSNKYLDYRSAYLLCPLLLTLSTVNGVAGANLGAFQPATAGATTTADYAVGLKNWFGSIIHSFTMDYNGTTIIQQTPYINMWNSFRLMTSLSLDDVNTQGPTIGFYPDDPTSWQFNLVGTATPFGTGVCNNSNFIQNPAGILTTGFNIYNAGAGNIGFLKRQQFINFDPQGQPGSADPTNYSTLLPIQSITNLWKGSIYNKVNTSGTAGLIQIAITATIYLKHIHSFFAMVPLLKGVFMKMTMNLNNCSTTVNIAGSQAAASVTTALTLQSSSVPVGGVLPIMIASASTNNGFQNVRATANNAAATGQYIATLSVGGRCLNSSVVGTTNSPLAQSIYLYVPAFSFNPIFEQSYLSSPVKQINYTDIYQYQVLNVGPASPFNNLLSNGIANIKSILILPFYSATAGTANTQLPQGIPVYQSPFDPAGTGPTSPLSLLTNLNFVISGQNAIYNTQRYSFEEFNNQLYGCNAVNAGLTDGVTSGLINSLGFEMEYCYYYCNVSRMLPVEESVPKSVQIVGTNQSGYALDLWCFVEYGCDVSIDILSGSRV